MDSEVKSLGDQSLFTMVTMAAIHLYSQFQSTILLLEKVLRNRKMVNKTEIVLGKSGLVRYFTIHLQQVDVILHMPFHPLPFMTTRFKVNMKTVIRGVWKKKDLLPSPSMR